MVTSEIIYTSPYVIDNNFRVRYFLIGLLSFSYKSYYCKCHKKKSQRSTNKYAFRLLYGVLVEFRWTPKVCWNHNAGSWWTTHWCVNHIFLFWVNHQVHKPRHSQMLNHQKVDQLGKKKVTGYQFIIQFVPVFFFHRKFWILLSLYFLLFQSLLTEFIFGCYNYYTDIWSNWYLIYCVMLLTIQ